MSEARDARNAPSRIWTGSKPQLHPAPQSDAVNSESQGDPNQNPAAAILHAQV